MYTRSTALPVDDTAMLFSRCHDAACVRYVAYLAGFRGVQCVPMQVSVARCDVRVLATHRDVPQCAP